MKNNSNDDVLNVPRTPVEAEKEIDQCYWLRSSERKVENSRKKQNNVRSQFKHRKRTIDCNDEKAKYKERLASTCAVVAPSTLMIESRGIKFEPGTPNLAIENIPEKGKMVLALEVVRPLNGCDTQKSCKRKLNFSLKRENEIETMLDQEPTHAIHQSEKIDENLGIGVTSEIRSLPASIKVYNRRKRGEFQVTNKSMAMEDNLGVVTCRECKVECDLKEAIKPKMLLENGDEKHHLLDPCDQTLHLSTRTMQECQVLEENIDEQERNCFHERVKSFISHMQCIQGDRKFSLWKGSVADSIIGAFLTQNVKDHVSSSAFMSLASKYPLSHSPLSLTTSKKEKVYTRRAKKGKLEEETKCGKKRAKKERKVIDWANLKKLYSVSDHRKQIDGKLDAVDWNAVMNAPAEEISRTIEKRGQHMNIATRIKDFLNFSAKELGSTDLEWLRNVPHHKAKECLLSIHGIGLKSVECIRLLMLRQPAFPIDTNAGRIVVRLGWVPLQALPGGHRFHSLNKYPHIDTVQKYLWPRLSKLDPLMLYELHCHMITFGKVFCTKRNPNCNSCPLREECKHFESSSRGKQLALPEGSNISMALAVNSHNQDIEDFGFNNSPRFRLKNRKLKNKTLLTKLRNTKSPKNKNPPTKLRNTKRPKNKTPLTKSKNTKRTRTDHQVYMLPDSHKLVAELPKREPDDPCSYLLAIWTQENVEKDEFLSLDAEPEEDIVYGTFLVPSRTSMRGSFPLNGTFFQVNEVFADEETSEAPIKVLWSSIRDLESKTLHCGTSISAIFKGMTSDEVKRCFLGGFVCLRGFDRRTRESKQLPRRFYP